MPIAAFIARQLRQPSGGFGRIVVARLLDRANGPMRALTLESLELAPDDRVLEIGPGGGDPIARLAPRVQRGRIAGVLRLFEPDLVPELMRRAGLCDVRAVRGETRLAAFVCALGTR